MALKSRLAGAIGISIAMVCNPLWGQTTTPRPGTLPGAPAQTAPGSSGGLQQTTTPSSTTITATPAPNITTSGFFAPGVTSSTAPSQIPVPIVTPPPVADSQIVQTTQAAPTTAVPVFGQLLFQGAFASESLQGFNPDYQVAIDDILDVRIWGAYTAEARVQVDSQGNVFVPTVGPVRVANVRNADLNQVVETAVKRKYRENVSVYASLAATQPVKVFVSGFVVRPGLYGANASDSILRFLDLAGGIAPLSGSYLNVSVLRGGNEIAKINLYDFLLSGKLPLIQLRDGDSIFVGPLTSTATITGLVATPARYEFDGTIPLQQLLTMAGAYPTATHVRITHNFGNTRRAEYLPLSRNLSYVRVGPGDELELVADRLIGEIIVQVEGEHLGNGQYVLPYNATLKDLFEKIQYSPQSLREGVQLYRLSVATRQKQLLDETLNKLESAIYSARSTTVEEAQLRTQEAALIEKFITGARQIQPKGQLVLTQSANAERIPLEDGDVIRIPRINPVISVHGEVYFANSFVRDESLQVKDYILKAGGATQVGDVDKVLILRPDGEVYAASASFWGDRIKLQDGDEILVLPKVDTKTFQFAKDIVTVLFQTATIAGVALRF